MEISACELPMVALMPSAIPHTAKAACLHALLMKMRLRFFLVATMMMISACTYDKPEVNDNMVFVEGGAAKNSLSNAAEASAKLPGFYIGKYEVTQKEWIEVMGNNPSTFQGEQLPVEMVSWYDVVEYCNQRSMKENLTPYYNIDKENKDPNNLNEYDPLKWNVTVNPDANGYRLPTEAEWEYAASGGALSQNYTYSGGNDIDEVAWNWKNAGDKQLSGEWNWPVIETNNNATKQVGTRKPNELGIYDMSGNVREWCWDGYSEGAESSNSFRVVKGGGWIGGEHTNEISFRGKFDASGFGPDQGFRVVRGE